MIKINYPPEVSFAEEFKQKVIVAKSIKRGEIDSFLKEFKINKPFEELLILSLEKLIKLPKITDHKIKKVYKFKTEKELSDKKKEIASWFNYKELQKGVLSIFFMKYSEIIKLKSCCYCNLDFVNIFVGLENEYFNKFDLINNHRSKKELELIVGIGDNRSTVLSKLKGKIYDENDFNELVEDKELKRILNDLFDKNGKIKIKKLKLHNHFTLDHLLPQKDYPYLSLSLFNLVPSCYSCNSKFKKEKDFFIDIKDLKILSPTFSSNKTNLNDFLEFRIFYEDSFSNSDLPITKDHYKIKLLSKYGDYKFIKTPRKI